MHHPIEFIDENGGGHDTDKNLGRRPRERAKLTRRAE
jgi:hypothetical protein